MTFTLIITFFYGCSFNIGSLLVHLFFFFNDTATTEISPLSLPDALPISVRERRHRLGPAEAIALGDAGEAGGAEYRGLDAAPGARRRHEHDLADARDARRHRGHQHRDRKSTRLNSSHSQNSYAVFCFKKK